MTEDRPRTSKCCAGGEKHPKVKLQAGACTGTGGEHAWYNAAHDERCEWCGAPKEDQ